MLCYAMVYFVKDMLELTVYTCTFIQLCEKNSTISGVGLDFSEKQRACVRKGSTSRDIASCIIYLIIHQYILTCSIYQFYE